jgi:hypothetical protein
MVQNQRITMTWPIVPTSVLAKLLALVLKDLEDKKHDPRY